MVSGVDFIALKTASVKRASIHVLMPVYNHELYVLDAVESVISQSFSDFLLTILDNGSTDGCLQLLSMIDDPRVTILHRSSNKLPPFDGSCFEIDRFEYFCFMYSDDLWHPNFLESAVLALKLRPSYQYWFCSILRFSDVKSFNFAEHSITKSVRELTPASFRNFVSHGWPFGANAVVYRIGCWRYICDSSFFASEGDIFKIGLLYRGLISPDVLLAMREHPYNHAKSRTEAFYASIRFYDELLAFLLLHGIDKDFLDWQYLYLRLAKIYWIDTLYDEKACGRDVINFAFERNRRFFWSLNFVFGLLFRLLPFRFRLILRELKI